MKCPHCGRDIGNIAVTLGKLGGLVSSEAKARAARQNVKKASAARWANHHLSPEGVKRKARRDRLRKMRAQK